MCTLSQARLDCQSLFVRITDLVLPLESVRPQLAVPPLRDVFWLVRQRVRQKQHPSLREGLLLERAEWVNLLSGHRHDVFAVGGGFREEDIEEELAGLALLHDS